MLFLQVEELGGLRGCNREQLGQGFEGPDPCRVSRVSLNLAVDIVSVPSRPSPPGRTSERSGIAARHDPIGEAAP